MIFYVFVAFCLLFDRTALKRRTGNGGKKEMAWDREMTQEAKPGHYCAMSTTDQASPLTMDLFQNLVSKYIHILLEFHFSLFVPHLIRIFEAAC